MIQIRRTEDRKLEVFIQEFMKNSIDKNQKNFIFCTIFFFEKSINKKFLKGGGVKTINEEKEKMETKLEDFAKPM